MMALGVVVVTIMTMMPGNGTKRAMGVAMAGSSTTRTPFQHHGVIVEGNPLRKRPWSVQQQLFAFVCHVVPALLEVVLERPAHANATP